MASNRGVISRLVLLCYLLFNIDFNFNVFDLFIVQRDHVSSSFGVHAAFVANFYSDSSCRTLAASNIQNVSLVSTNNADGSGASACAPLLSYWGVTFYQQSLCLASTSSSNYSLSAVLYANSSSCVSTAVAAPLVNLSSTSNTPTSALSACATVHVGARSFHIRLKCDAVPLATTVPPSTVATIADPCWSYTSCSACAEAAACGWCTTSNSTFGSSCLNGVGSGPSWQAACPLTTPNAWAYTADVCPDQPNPCPNYSDCSTCSSAANCGWCNGTCFKGTSTGPLTGSCGNVGWVWTEPTCSLLQPNATDPCSRYHDCAACAYDTSCGWCNNQCHSGTKSAPYVAGVCNGDPWNSTYLTCPRSNISDACSAFSDCASCAPVSECGWCNGMCRSGTTSGPTSTGSCGIFTFMRESTACAFLNPNTTDPCLSKYSDCASCAYDTACGWCNSACHSGGKLGAYIPGVCNGDSWNPTYLTCPRLNNSDQCSAFRNCASCAAVGVCGWCNGMCRSGTASGPTDTGSCGVGGVATWMQDPAACALLNPNATDSCSTYTSCGACASDGVCGWCNGGCHRGLNAGPYIYGVCNGGAWSPIPATCPRANGSDPCSIYGDCVSCGNTNNCGWCNNTCYSGPPAGPTSNGVCGATAWLSDGAGCPLLTPNATDPCNAYTASCSDCTSQASCGWCNGQCLSGDGNGAYLGGVNGACKGKYWAWVSDGCARAINETNTPTNAPTTSPTTPPVTDACASFTPCETCTSHGSCGWCETGCGTGSSSRPSATGACGNSSAYWLFYQSGCPLIQPNATDPCMSHSDCYSCSNTAACGWCTGDHKCHTGSSSGPTIHSAVCTAQTWVWSSGSCPLDPNATDPCSANHNCMDCAQAPNCGWCGTSCHRGSFSGPAMPGVCAANQPWVYVSTGCATSGPNGTDPCASITDCAICSTSDSCGWCGINGCHIGNSDGPVLPVCGNEPWIWYSGACYSGNASGLCAQHDECSACTTDAFCGWCDGHCYAGGFAGPSDPSVSCSDPWTYSSYNCPDFCSHSTTCEACTTAGPCGWCGGQCVSGRMGGPTQDGACNASTWAYSQFQCPSPLAGQIALNASMDPCLSYSASCSDCTVQAQCGYCGGNCRMGTEAGPYARDSCGSSYWAWSSTVCSDTQSSYTWSPQLNGVELSHAWVSLDGARAVSTHSTFFPNRTDSWSCDMTTKYTALVFDPTTSSIIVNLPFFATNRLNGGNLSNCPNFVPVGVVGGCSSTYSFFTSVIDLTTTNLAFNSSAIFGFGGIGSRFANRFVDLTNDGQTVILTASSEGTCAPWIAPLDMASAINSPTDANATRPTNTTATDPATLSSGSTFFTLPVVPYVSAPTFNGYMFAGSTVCDDNAALGVTTLLGRVGTCTPLDYGGMYLSDSVTIKSVYVVCQGVEWSLDLYSSADCSVPVYNGSAGSVPIVRKQLDGVVPTSCGGATTGTGLSVSAIVNCMPFKYAPPAPTTPLPASWFPPPSAISQDPWSQATIIVVFATIPTLSQLNELQTLLASTCGINTDRVSLFLPHGIDPKPQSRWWFQLSFETLADKKDEVSITVVILPNGNVPGSPTVSAAVSRLLAALGSPQTSSSSQVPLLSSTPLFTSLQYQRIASSKAVYACLDGTTVTPCPPMPVSDTSENFLRVSYNVAWIVVVAFIVLVALLIGGVIYWRHWKKTAGRVLLDDRAESNAVPNVEHAEMSVVRRVSLSTAAVSQLGLKNHTQARGDSETGSGEEAYEVAVDTMGSSATGSSNKALGARFQYASDEVEAPSAASTAPASIATSPNSSNPTSPRTPASPDTTSSSSSSVASSKKGKRVEGEGETLVSTEGGSKRKVKWDGPANTSD